MKCFKHNASEAVAVCAHCGRAVCSDCTQPESTARIACSTTCAAELSRADELLHQISTINQQLLQNSLRNTRASAFYCYLCAALSAAAAVVAWFMLPSPFLILFTGGCAVVLLLSGFWYGLAARRSAPVLGRSNFRQRAKTFFSAHLLTACCARGRARSDGAFEPRSK